MFNEEKMELMFSMLPEYKNIYEIEKELYIAENTVINDKGDIISKPAEEDFKQIWIDRVNQEKINNPVLSERDKQIEELKMNQAKANAELVELVFNMVGGV